VWPHSEPFLFDLMRDAGKDCGVKWKHNALQHSFISYRVAKIKNVNEVAMEAGNSPDMIFKHYRELVTEKAADAWFGVTPAAVKAARAKMAEDRRQSRPRRNGWADLAGPWRWGTTGLNWEHDDQDQTGLRAADG